MGYPTKVQVIQRKASQQWYVNFPAALARAMEFNKGQTVEWTVQSKDTLLLRRVAQSLASNQDDGKKKR
jgi:antitoxin component of MazEF toxin-antitoxin module